MRHLYIYAFLLLAFSYTKKALGSESDIDQLEQNTLELIEQ